MLDKQQADEVVHMLPAVSQTLANVLVHHTSLRGTEGISFNPPGDELTGKPGFHVYCYNVSEHLTHPLQCHDLPQSLGQEANSCESCAGGGTYFDEIDSSGAYFNGERIGGEWVGGERALHWFDICFVVIAQDYTALGKHQLLSEALMSFLNHQFLDEEYLAPELQGFGKLAITITPHSVIQPSVLWQSLGVPVRPALYITVTVPILAMNPAIAPSNAF